MATIDDGEILDSKDDNRGRQTEGSATGRTRIITALIVVFKLTLFAIVLLFVFRALAARLVDFTLADIELAYWFVVWALVCILFRFALSVVVRSLMLASLWHRPGWAAMCAIAWVPLIGKYVPGKFASVAGAVWMLRKYGVPGAVAAGVVFIVHGMMVVLGLVLAAPMTLWPVVYRHLPLAWLWCTLLIAVGIICLHPRVFTAIANVLLRMIRRPALQVVPRVRSYLPPLLVGLVIYALAGIALWFLAGSVKRMSFWQIPFFISTAALAGTAGFLAFFAPAGIGVREGILLMVLSPVIGGGYAAIVVVAWRLLQTIVEVVLAGIGLVILRSLRQKETIIGGAVE